MTGLRVTTSRLIPAPPARVYELWTRPEHLVRWWGPPGGRCVGAVVDPIAGGAYRLDNTTPDGTMVTISGTFTTVDPPRLLAYTWRIASGPVELVTVTLAEADGGTLVDVTHERVADESAAREHVAGWAACLDRLAAHVVAPV